MRRRRLGKPECGTGAGNRHLAGLAVERLTLTGAALTGLGNGLENRLTFTMCRDLLDEVVLVSEAAIRDAMQALFTHDRMVAEGGAVVGLAAVMTGAATASAVWPTRRAWLRPFWPWAG